MDSNCEVHIAQNNDSAGQTAKLEPILEGRGWTVHRPAKAEPILEERGWTVQRNVVRLEQQPYKKMFEFRAALSWVELSILLEALSLRKPFLEVEWRCLYLMQTKVDKPVSLPWYTDPWSTCGGHSEWQCASTWKFNQTHFRKYFCLDLLFLTKGYFLFLPS
ncbi:hypothetical protein C8R45DRAFT_936739 [Mycena sanguinolenta]|nr:hypothetical protein C8R45DRAFT_936739 [Mycena sanguinolenta]